MVEKDKVLAGKMKHTGIFNFSELYEFVYDSCMSENYRVREKKYSEKILGESKTIEIEWIAEKKVSDYFKFNITLRWLITGLKKVEVKKEDSKVTMNSGAVEIVYSAVIIKDYESRWENQAVWKFLRGLYDRYIIRPRIDYYEDKVEDELRELISQIKAFLALEAKRL
jgi:hypothetical protein